MLPRASALDVGVFFILPGRVRSPATSERANASAYFAYCAALALLTSVVPVSIRLGTGFP